MGFAPHVAGHPFLREVAQDVVDTTSTTSAKAANKVFIFIFGYFNQVYNVVRRYLLCKYNAHFQLPVAGPQLSDVKPARKCTFTT